MPKAAVTFKLRFGEPLVGSAVVGKNWVLFLVVEDVCGFVAGERGLYVNHGPGVVGSLGIDNRANDTMRGAVFRIFHVLQGAQIEGNVHSEINADLRRAIPMPSKFLNHCNFTMPPPRGAGDY